MAFQDYLAALTSPFKKLTKLEFLQPDNSVAFALDNTYKSGYNNKYDSRAFIQQGSLSVTLQNGQRRKASVMLSNLDGAFEYAVNKLWFGQRMRLSMGMILPDGSEFYLPQGVFYADNPSSTFMPTERTATYSLVDKWSYLDGSLFGQLEEGYQVDEGTDVFDAMSSLLTLSKIDFSNDAPSNLQIDNVLPTFTAWYNDKTYPIAAGGTVNMRDVPYDILVDSDSGTIADVITELNTIITGLIGYDQNGSLRVDPSQDDISDVNKPILWTFSPDNSTFCGVDESIQNAETYNDIIIIGEDLTSNAIYGRATNYDLSSPTNVNLIGRKIYRESRSSYWNAQQCIDLASFMLKQKTILQRSITIHSTQMFHLYENGVVAVKRTDKPGQPIERHLIQSFTVPLAETGEMTVNATAISDNPVISTESSNSPS